MSGSKLPTTPKEVTSEWLTSVLREINLLEKETKVSIAETSAVEGGQNSTVLRLKVTYSGATIGLPPSFVVKLTTSQDNSSNEKELYFYKNVASIGLPYVFRAPKAYLADKTGSTYVFLLEDLEQAKHVSQTEAADYNLARRMVIAMAAFHSKFWNSSLDAFTKLKESYCPVAEPESYWENFQHRMEKSIDDFNILVHDEEVQKSTKFCATNFAKLVRLSQEPPCTLVHGDARISNYFFEGEKGVVAVDWQGFNVGSGPGDLAYFLSMNVQEEVRKKHETEFLHLYHDLLMANGVKDFSFEALYRKYLVGVAMAGKVALFATKDILEGRKLLEGSPSGRSEDAKEKIALHDILKPMVDLWCATAHNHAITSIEFGQRQST